MDLGPITKVVNVDKALSIPPYDGRGDPDDHLEMYTGHMLLYSYSEEIIC